MKAWLISPHRIKVVLYGPLINHDRELARLRVNFSHLESMKIMEETLQSHLTTLVFERSTPLELGHAYELIIESFGSVPIDVTEALHFPDFHTLYTYPFDDLGATYTVEQTTFKVWAPLASSVVLNLFKNGVIDQHIPMRRETYGVYTYSLQGNHDGLVYTYDITNHGVTRRTLDPYAKGSTRNSEASVVINLDRLNRIPDHDHRLPPMHAVTDAILYEAHVRDLTSDPNTDIVHKGRFLGMLEKNRKHSALGIPVGWDYLTSLGFTHLQLLPVNDFRSVDEFHVETSYNWGYDPYQFAAIEGSFASELDDPYSRLMDFKQLVSQFHEAGIRINLDVVYNHVFEFQYSVFEKVVPGYYFRKKSDGTMSNGSFCGNDIASEKPMVQHLLLHVATYWVKTFHIDGYRFDLMGIIDQQTMDKLQQAIHAIRPDFMLYGEGWNMPTELPYEQKTITERHGALSYLSFFNDEFRNGMKGGNFESDILVKGYTTGNGEHVDAAISQFLGSSIASLGGYKVTHPYQSINYVECHDNGTFYDKLVRLYPTASEEELQAYIRFSLSVVLLSQGIPFLHMAQEVGGSKFGDHNSYKSGDVVNQFHYERIVPYAKVIETLRSLIHLRKDHPIFRQPFAWKDENFTIQRYEHGIFVLTLTHDDQCYIVGVNPTPEPFLLPHKLSNGSLIFDGQSYVKRKASIDSLPGLSILVLKQS